MDAGDEPCHVSGLSGDSAYKGGSNAVVAVDQGGGGPDKGASQARGLRERMRVSEYRYVQRRAL